LNEIYVHIRVVKILCHITWLPSGKINLLTCAYYEYNINFMYYNNMKILLCDINLFKAQNPI
jgi:hypothetical protein